MGISQIIAGVSAFVTGLLPLSCHHHAATPSSPPPAPPAAVSGTNSVVNSPLHDLGDLSLTNHCEREVSLGQGKECTLLPNLVDAHNAEITVTYESKLPSGQVHDMIVTQFDTKNGEAVEITLGDLQLAMKPNVLPE